MKIEFQSNHRLLTILIQEKKEDFLEKKKSLN